MKLNIFFSRHPIFRIDELYTFLDKRGSSNPATRNALIAHHLESGHIVRIRQGLYASVPTGISAEKYIPDPYLVAARATDDSVLAYHTALEIHGAAYSVQERFVYLTQKDRGDPFRFRGSNYHATNHPKAIQRSEKVMTHVQSINRMGLPILVTNLERTLVDTLDRPRFSGSIEEIWRSIEGIDTLDPVEVATYALLLENATTIARVGFTLEQFQKQWFVSEQVLQSLQGDLPRSPHYFYQAHAGSGKLVSKWNLIVPDEIIQRTWEEEG
jgi:predicted transcriptional regulator of viral defense system